MCLPAHCFLCSESSLRFARNHFALTVFVSRVGRRMKLRFQWRAWLCSGLMAASFVADAAPANGAAENPFAVIFARNVFRLRPFQDQTHVVEKAPPKVLPKIVVTGVTDVCGRKQALVEISEIGKPSTRPVLAEGETFAGVQVVEIDVEESLVKVRVMGEEIELDLQPARPSPPPPPAPVLAVRR